MIKVKYNGVLCDEGFSEREFAEIELLARGFDRYQGREGVVKSNFFFFPNNEGKILQAEIVEVSDEIPFSSLPDLFPFFRH